MFGKQCKKLTETTIRSKCHPIYALLVVLCYVTSASFFQSFAVLAGSVMIESASLLVAINETRKNAKIRRQSFWGYGGLC